MEVDDGLSVQRSRPASFSFGRRLAEAANVVGKVTQSVGDVITRTAASAGELLVDSELRWKGTSKFLTEAQKGVQTIQKGVGELPGRIGQKLQEGAITAMQHGMKAGGRPVQIVQRVIAKQLAELQRYNQLSSDSQPLVDIQIGPQVYEDMPQEMRSRLWYVILEDSHLVESLRPLHRPNSRQAARFSHTSFHNDCSDLIVLSSCPNSNPHTSTPNRAPATLTPTIGPTSRTAVGASPLRPHLQLSMDNTEIELSVFAPATPDASTSDAQPTPTSPFVSPGATAWATAHHTPGQAADPSMHDRDLINLGSPVPDSILHNTVQHTFHPTIHSTTQPAVQPTMQPAGHSSPAPRYFEGNVINLQSPKCSIEPLNRQQLPAGNSARPLDSSMPPHSTAVRSEWAWGSLHPSSGPTSSTVAAPPASNTSAHSLGSRLHPGKDAPPATASTSIAAPEWALDDLGTVGSAELRAVRLQGLSLNGTSGPTSGSKLGVTNMTDRPGSELGLTDITDTRGSKLGLTELTDRLGASTPGTSCEHHPLATRSESPTQLGKERPGWQQQWQGDRGQRAEVTATAVAGLEVLMQPPTDVLEWELVPSSDGKFQDGMLNAQLARSCIRRISADGDETMRKALSELKEAMSFVPWPIPTDFELDCKFATLNSITLGQEEVDEVIYRDINRTFPEHPYFGERAGQMCLFRILKAYSLHDLEVGYCQGMAFVAGILLMYLPEEPAFRLFCCLMCETGPNMRRLYLPGLEPLKVELARLEHLVAHHMPDLFAHLREYGIPAVLYASQWFLTSYSCPFPHTFAARVLDIMLQDGNDKILQRVALSILKECRKELLELDDFEAIITCLKVTPVKWPQHQLRKVLNNALASQVTDLELEESLRLATAETAKLARDASSRHRRTASLQRLPSTVQAAAAAAVAAATGADPLHPQPTHPLRLPLPPHPAAPAATRPSTLAAGGATSPPLIALSDGEEGEGEESLEDTPLEEQFLNMIFLQDEMDSVDLEADGMIDTVFGL